MKKLFLPFLFLLIGLAGPAQDGNPQEAPYKRFKTLPPFRLLLIDSSTYYTREDLSKKSSVMLMIFSPDCEHCQHETEQIIQNINDFDKTQIIMATPREFKDMLRFYSQYDLGRFKNIIVGQDVNYIFPVFFDVHNLPFLAFYNRKKELISVFEGAMPIEKMIAEIKK